MKNLKFTKAGARKLRYICCAFAIAATACVGNIASAQIVTNGNFEANASSYSGYGLDIGINPTGWTSSGITSGLGGAGITSGSAYQEPNFYNGATDPSVFAYVDNNRASGGYVQQAITLAADTSYTLSFQGASKVRDGDPTDAPATGDVLVYDNAGTLTDVTITSLTTLGSDFTLYTASFTTGSDTTGATLELLMTQVIPTPTDAYPYGGDFVEASDFAIAPLATTPEPTTYALVFAGLGTLALMTRLRRKA